MFNELGLYIPIFQMALAQGWAIQPQYQLPKVQPRPGPFETVDFMFRKDIESEPCFLGMEVKFIKELSSYNQSFIKDIKKLEKIRKSSIIKWNNRDVSIYDYCSVFLFALEEILYTAIFMINTKKGIRILLNS